MPTETKSNTSMQPMQEVVASYLGTFPEGLDIDFSDTEPAFAHRSDGELRKIARLFGLMNNHWLVGIGSKIGLTAIKLHLPFVEGAVRKTIFEQFCGGETLLESRQTIDRLSRSNVLSILDYGAEGKESEADFNHTMNETIRAIEFAAGNPRIPMVSTKLTGLARFGLLEARSTSNQLSPEEEAEYELVLKRVDAICHAAMRHGMTISIDAEESWIQPAIDELALRMASRYNQQRVVVYNTYQMYRTDRLDTIRAHYAQAGEGGFMLGAKLVRGAYMDKERNRAEEEGYPSPIYPDKPATDEAYNRALLFCLEHYKELACCNASHNTESALLMAAYLVHHHIPRNHPHALFAQLYGMSDNLTYNLAKAGFNVGKYVIYGPVREVTPYLIRRAEENTSVAGDMSREYRFVIREIQRRAKH